MTDQGKAYIFGLSTVALWSTVASAFKLSLAHLDTIQLLFYSSLVSVITLGLILAIQGRFRLVFGFSKRQYLMSLGFGLLNPFFYYLVLFKAYDLLPAQEALALNYTWAITLVFLSIPLLKQKIAGRDLLATFFCYSGVVVISTHGDPFSLQFSSPLGVGLALGSTIIWALYWIFNTKDTRDPVAGLFLGFLFSLPFTFAACAGFSSLAVSHWKGLAGAAYVGVFEMGITYVLWLNALKHSENTAKVSNLIFISPFASLVFISFFVGEKILVSTLAGLVLIVGGLLLQQIKKPAAKAG